MGGAAELRPIHEVRIWNLRALAQSGSWFSGCYSHAHREFPGNLDADMILFVYCLFADLLLFDWRLRHCVLPTGTPGSRGDSLEHWGFDLSRFFFPRGDSPRDRAKPSKFSAQGFSLQHVSSSYVKRAHQAAKQMLCSTGMSIVTAYG